MMIGSDDAYRLLLHLALLIGCGEIVWSVLSLPRQEAAFQQYWSILVRQEEILCFDQVV